MSPGKGKVCDSFPFSYRVITTTIDHIAIQIVHIKTYKPRDRFYAIQVPSPQFKSNPQFPTLDDAYVVLFRKFIVTSTPAFSRLISASSRTKSLFTSSIHLSVHCIYTCTKYASSSVFFGFIISLTKNLQLHEVVKTPQK